MLLALLSVLNAASGSNVQYVNPFIGTEQPITNQGNYGGMIPSTGTPFAMTRWTPMTQENIVGSCPYEYTSKEFHGFLGTHQPAVWMGESAEVAVTAGTGDVKTSFKDRTLAYSHEGEISSPHYYRVQLQTPTLTNIVAELTATSRASSMRFTFDAADSGNRFVVIQATRGGIYGEIQVDAANREIYGYNPERQDSVLGPFKAADFKGYFVAKFDQDFSGFGVANGATLSPNSEKGSGVELSAYVQFGNANINSVGLRVGVSYISYEQARQNLYNEIPDGVTLEDTAKVVEQQWAEKLNLINITNATVDETAIFYTSMYHALQVSCICIYLYIMLYYISPIVSK